MPQQKNFNESSSHPHLRYFYRHSQCLLVEGDPSVLVYEDVPKPVPQHDEIVVQIHYAGLNYIDTYHRSGLYKVNFPFTLGIKMREEEIDFL